MLFLINSTRIELKDLDSFLLQEEFPPPPSQSGAFSERLVVTLSSPFINSHNLAFILVGTISSYSPEGRYVETFFRILISQDST